LVTCGIPLATSEIDGLQGTGEMDQVKHYAVYHQETYRNTAQDDVIIDNRTLREIYLPAFQAATQQSLTSPAPSVAMALRTSS
jgi:beta-glucosidase